mgnify:CR=1 FL=1
MGYTHYFRNAKATPEVVADAHKIIGATTVELAGWNGEGEPVVNNEDGISLNGSEARGEAHEDFTIGLQPEFFGFCKTGGDDVPYDEVVTAILVSVHMNRAGEISSDGTFEEWSKGIALYEKAVRPLSLVESDSLRTLLD